MFDRSEKTINFALTINNATRVKFDRLIRDRVVVDAALPLDDYIEQGYLPVVGIHDLNIEGHNAITPHNNDRVLINLSDEVKERLAVKKKQATEIVLLYDSEITYVKIHIVNKFDCYYLGYYYHIDSRF